MAADLDLLQGTLDLLILKALTWGPKHGYAVASWVRQTTDAKLNIEEGALYTALHRMLSFVLAAFLLQAPTASPQSAGPAARNPAYSRDGRLAVSVDGDLWVVAKSGEWRRLTSGPA